ncbi:MAG: metallophosphoesterase [Clostridia bacterium]|nr:metallophosphoesterase [Clostridia bacterium]
MRIFLVVFLIAAVVLIPSGVAVKGYLGSQPKLRYEYSTSTQQNMPAYPNARFAVISDTHYYDTSLGTTGAAFEVCMNSDRKLLADSADLLSFAVGKILKSGVQFVLVTGDLTKDGELICHEGVAKQLSRLTAAGIKVYVTPGNHDVDNPGAFRYSGSKKISVANVTPAKFEQIYYNDGYMDAIMRDSGTLSYVAEPVKGLWLISLDTCRYAENRPGGVAAPGGRVTQSEQNWLEGVLKKANAEGKAVMVMEHHGLVEHCAGQAKLHPDYLLPDYRYESGLLASYGVRLAFTGHYHAQDITLADFKDGGYIYDIETGSLITPPCALRSCTISDNRITVRSEDLVGELHPGTDFAKKALAFETDVLETQTAKVLRKYFVPESDASYIAKYIALAFEAHYSGDENPAKRPAFDESRLSFWGRVAFSVEKYVPQGLWSDLPPADNNVTLDLSKK